MELYPGIVILAGNSSTLGYPANIQVPAWLYLMKNNIILLLAVGLLFVGHACKGWSDTLLFHYDESRFAEFADQGFWKPAGPDCEKSKTCSWTKKYKRDPDGRLKRPLEEKFLGSSTIFVATTDAWHLLQSIQFTCTRLAIVLILTPLINMTFQFSRRIWTSVVLFIAIWIVQAAGFHLTYTWFQ